MILSDTEILKSIEAGDIVITPFNPDNLGSNSFDVCLGSTLAVYWPLHGILDSRTDNSIEYIEIPGSGFVLKPETLYLGVTKEYTETHKHVPFLEGKSSVGRLGINIHSTAGKGDVGFCGYWTLEISVVQPVKIYAGMKIGQLIYFKVEGCVKNPYDRKVSAKYNNTDSKPMRSMLWKNFVN